MKKLKNILEKRCGKCHSSSWKSFEGVLKRYLDITATMTTSFISKIHT